MALQWVILSCAVAAEAAVAILLTLPAPKALSSRLLALVSRLLQPTSSIVPYAVFNLFDIHWKQEHRRLTCKSDVCTVAERDRYERSRM